MEPNQDGQPPAEASKMNPEQLQSDIDTIKNVLTETEKSKGPHRIIIAAGNFICGFLMLIIVPLMLMAVGIVGVATPEPAPGEPSPTMIVGTVAIFVILCVMLLSLPFLLAGWGLIKRKSWANVMAIIAGVLNLTNLPLGTALAIYTFWAVIQGKLSDSE